MRSIKMRPPISKGDINLLRLAFKVITTRNYTQRANKLRIREAYSRLLLSQTVLSIWLNWLVLSILPSLLKILILLFLLAKLKIEQLVSL